MFRKALFNKQSTTIMPMPQSIVLTTLTTNPIVHEIQNPSLLEQTTLNLIPPINNNQNASTTFQTTEKNRHTNEEKLPEISPKNGQQLSSIFIRVDANVLAKGIYNELQDLINFLKPVMKITKYQKWFDKFTYEPKRNHSADYFIFLKNLAEQAIAEIDNQDDHAAKKKSFFCCNQNMVPKFNEIEIIFLNICYILKNLTPITTILNENKRSYDALYEQHIILRKLLYQAYKNL